MHYRPPVTALAGALPAVIVASTLLAAGCQADITGSNANAGTGATPTAGTAGAAGSSTGGAGAGGTGGTDTGGTGGTTGGTGGGTGVMCQGTHVVVPKRIVRLSPNQVINTYAALFDPAMAAAIATAQDVPEPALRSFPPLASGGTSIGDTLFGQYDRMAQAAMAHVATNVATLTPCGAAPTDANCAQQFLFTFAERAFRRPLSAEDQAAITTHLWQEMTTDGATVATALQYGVYGILSAPHFLYRTELGGAPLMAGALDPYEMASQISYFVADGPPDAELLAAAAANTLSTPDQIRPHVTRLLALPAARTNLEAAMVAYFQIPAVPTVVIDSDSVPGINVTGGLLASMYREGELFMKNTLWQGALGDLLTSRTTYVNNQIAMPIYGVATPVSVDADGFGAVMLPADRAGLLTLSPFLVSKARPDHTSAVARGLQINAALICADNPPFPEDDPGIAAEIAAQAGWSEKQKADARAANPLCGGCHAAFDAFGMVLESYDTVGRYRTMDPEGRIIDTAWTTGTLPETFLRDIDGDGMLTAADAPSLTVTNPAELAQAVILSGNLNRCMAMNLANFALGDVTQGGAGAPSPQPPTSSCAVQHMVDRFATTPQSFSDLIREIAASDTLLLRSAGM